MKIYALSSGSPFGNLCPWRKKSRSNHRKETLYSITRINYNSQLLYNSSLFSKTQFSSGGGFGAPKADLLTQKASKTRSLSTMFYHLCQGLAPGSTDTDHVPKCQKTECQPTLETIHPFSRKFQIVDLNSPPTIRLPPLIAWFI